MLVNFNPCREYSRPGITAAMLDNLVARQLLWARYLSRSLATNVRQFNSAVAAIEELVAATAEPVLRGPEVMSRFRDLAERIAGLLQPFAVADTFHDGLPLEGFLCHKTD